MLRLSPQLVPKQTLQLKQMLHPKLIQMFKLFQLPYHELVETIERESQNNVFIDVVRFDQLMNPASHRKSSARSESTADSADFEAVIPSKEKTLYEFLMSQLQLLHLSQKDDDIAKFLIQSIDQRGYLSDYEAVKKAIQQQMDVADRKIGEILKIIQTFEPEGVGARTLKECLLIQVEEYDFEHDSLRKILKEVISKHLDDFGTQSYDKISRHMKIPLEGVEQLAAFIKENLNPHPGLRFSNQSYDEILIPSFEVRFEKDSLLFTNLEKQKGIDVRLSEKYKAMLADPHTDPETKTYLSEHFKKASEFIENIQKRQDNLERIAKFIIQKQLTFIKSGPVYLEPLLQKDIAREFGLSSSTISRIVSAKVIQTPFGVYAFKSLCRRRVFGKTTEQLRAIIQDLFIHNPLLSDQQMTQLLVQHGIPMARRTVAKYRLELNISSKFKRGS